MMTTLKNILLAGLRSARVVAVWTVVVLLIPNFVLDYTENYGFLWKLANIILPLGVYLLVLVCRRRIGWAVMYLLPVMVLAAFQIVLLYLYGESVIAVDMYLNVVTTNMSEANELLLNLQPSLLLVVILYLPLLVWGGYLIVRKVSISGAARRSLARWGVAFTALGVVLSLGATFAHDEGSVKRSIFPVNVVCNLFEAINRTARLNRYHETSARFSYNARSLRSSSEREVYLYVIGETSRANNWQLAGYQRNTNPRLSCEENLVFFPKAVTESNTTHKSVPMLLTNLTANDFNCRIDSVRSIITAMNEAGFYTRFFSNQAPNGSYTEFFGSEASDVRYTGRHPDGSHPYDGELTDWIRQALADDAHPKQFIVVHTYGSHFRYRDRYPDAFSYFTPDNPPEAGVQYRKELINAYDNAIRYTDHVLSGFIDLLRESNATAALIYSADHGEDIFDDYRRRFLHASPNPTYPQLHVAMLAWVSDSFAERYPAMLHSLRANSHKPVSPQRTMFNTALDLCGVEIAGTNRRASLASGSYTPIPAVYLTDLNESRPLTKSGIKDVDARMLSSVVVPSVAMAQ